MKVVREQLPSYLLTRAFKGGCGEVVSSRERATPGKVRVEDKPRQDSKGVQEIPAKDWTAIPSSFLKSEDRGGVY